MERKTYRQNWVINTLSMLRLFMVQPYKKAKLSMEWEGVKAFTKSQDDGFFRFEFRASEGLKTGWHNISVQLEEEKHLSKKIQGHGEVFVPFTSSYVFVSDIDDTFLISHSSAIRRRMYVLLTKNARSRKPFAGVVNHYNLLSSSGQPECENSPFFYVSSSEWNLYDYIIEFSRENEMPKGVYLLNELKRFSQVWKTGQNKHGTKFFRIVRIVEAYPDRKFILFGDDSQEDPNIYSALVDHFKDKIFAIYIRKVHKSNFKTVQPLINKMIASGTHCCYFTHSAEAIADSKSIGIII